MCVMCLFAVARFHVIENSFVVSLLHSSPFLFPFSVFAFVLPLYLGSIGSLLGSKPNSRRKDVFFYALRTSGKILLSKHLSIIRAALLTFELSNPSGHIKIVYTKTFIHSFVLLHYLFCR